MDDQTLINFGGEIKSLGGYRFGGQAVVFGGADLAKDRFTKETDFDLYEGKRLINLYDHGLNDTFKRTRIGYGYAKIVDAGVWFEGEMEKRAGYEAHVDKVFEGIEAGKMGLSTGSVPHMVERAEAEDGITIIKSWPIVEVSITPTPCEPRTFIQSLKSYALEVGLDSMKVGARNAASDKKRLQAIHDAAAELEESVCLGMKKSLGDTLAVLPFAEKVEAVLAAVKTLTEQARGIHALRATEGRTLSRERRAGIAAVKSELDMLLASLVTPSEEGTRLYAEYMRDEVRRTTGPLVARR